MNSSIILMIAQAASAEGKPQPGIIESIFSNNFVFIGICIVLFWVLLIRPKNKERKEHEARMNALAKGDKVITTAGIHGTVTNIEKDAVSLEVANGVHMKFEKAAVLHVQKKNAEKADN